MRRRWSDSCQGGSVPGFGGWGNMDPRRPLRATTRSRRFCQHVSSTYLIPTSRGGTAPAVRHWIRLEAPGGFMLVISGWMLVAGLLLPNTSLMPPAQDHRADRSGPVSVWTDRDDPYRKGEGARVYIHAARPSHVAVFRVDTDGRIRVLFPRDPWGD